MSSVRPMRVGYVVKRYPRYSETFIVNELLAHQAAGLELEIFSLYPPSDTHFQDSLARVRAPVSYLLNAHLKAADFWAKLEEVGRICPTLHQELRAAQSETVDNVYRAAQLAMLVSLKGIDHLHAHFATAATTVARLAARFAEVPYTFTAHAKDIFHESVDAEDLGRKLEDAARVVTVSDFNVGYLQAQFGTQANRVVRLYNGLELDNFPYRDPADRPSQIVAVGRLVEKKGFADLVAACDIMVRRGAHFTCSIIGSGELEAHLRAEINRLGLGKVVDLTGPQPQIETIQSVQSAALLAAPCVVGRDGNRDGLPTVLLEAMALGTPCVSTPVTGITEIIKDRDTGLIVPEHDPASLAQAMQELLNAATERVRLARNARRLIEDECDVNRNAGKLRRFFTDAGHDELYSTSETKGDGAHDKATQLVT